MHNRRNRAYGENLVENFPRDSQVHNIDKEIESLSDLSVFTRTKDRVDVEVEQRHEREHGREDGVERRAVDFLVQRLQGQRCRYCTNGSQNLKEEEDEIMKIGGHVWYRRFRLSLKTAPMCSKALCVCILAKRYFPFF